MGRRGSRRRGLWRKFEGGREDCGSGRLSFVYIYDAVCLVRGEASTIYDRSYAESKLAVNKRFAVSESSHFNGCAWQVSFS